MTAPDRACPDYPNECYHPWAHARTYDEVKATQMAAPCGGDVAVLREASGDPEAFRIVYSALMARYGSSARVGHLTQFADEVAALAVQVLRSEGRLTAAHRVAIVGNPCCGGNGVEASCEVCRRG